MKTQLLKPFEDLPYFTLVGFKQILGFDEVTDQQARRLLSRWQKAGHILALKRGVYMTRRFFELHRNDVNFTPAISAILVPQSYLSLEYVLQQAGILTEATYTVTAVTVKNTRTFHNNALGTFVYRHIKPSLYTGFYQESCFGVIFHRASVAKALFDYLYLRPLPRRLRSHALELAEELRLNLDDFLPQSRLEFARYVEASASEKMLFIWENFQRTVWQP